MKTFEEVYRIVQETSSGEEAFNKEECRALYEILQNLPPHAFIVEIGVQFGRSMAVLGEVAKDLNFQVKGVDNWQEGVSPEARENVSNLIIKHKWPVDILNMDSVEAARITSQDVDFLHIDGGHEDFEVMADMEAWLPKLKQGGYVCFDDYGHDSLPGVFKAVTEYMSEHGGYWYLGRFGGKLGVFKKI